MLSVVGRTLTWRVPRQKPMPVPRRFISPISIPTRHCGRASTGVKPLVILASGSGTNAQVVLDAARGQEFDARVALLVSNRADAER